MKFPSKEIVEMLRKQYPVGSRVELVRMDDFQAPPIGTQGTVRGVDDAGSILVAWDNGCGLNVVYGEDLCVRVYDSEETKTEGSISIPKKDGGASIVHYWVTQQNKPDEDGINKGKVTRLVLKINGELIGFYDFEWLIEAERQEALIAICILLNNYN